MHSLIPFVGKFWRIATDEANGEEILGQSDNSSSVITVYLQVLARKIFWQIVHYSSANIFPQTVF